MSKEIVYDCIADSLTSYIQIIDGLKKNVYIESVTPRLYRGESKNYYEHNNNKPYFNASAFREQPIEGYEGGEPPFIKNIELFRHEVWSEIDTVTKKSFLAYAQHHGIKTNLIDFSLNPLVALFFAVEDRDYLSEPGYIYVMEEPVFNITPLLEKNNENNLNDILTTDSKDTLDDLLKYLREFSMNHPNSIKNYFHLLCLEYYRISKNDEEILLESDDLIASIVEDIALNDTNKRIMDYYDGYRDGGPYYLYYLILLRGYIKMKKYNPSFIDSDFSGALPMIYRPIMNFKRGTNQNGVFIHQNYTLSQGGFLLNTQRSYPTKIIKITNKKEIAESLDRIDINKKFIYGDHPSIARYIENKHQEIREAQQEINKDFDEGKI